MTNFSFLEYSYIQEAQDEMPTSSVPLSVSLPAMPIQLGLPVEGTLKQRISQILPPQNQSLVQETRRTSSRSIKRKKFDDEVVESSLIKTERGRVTKLPTVTQVLEKIEPVEKELPPAPPPEKKKVISDCT